MSTSTPTKPIISPKRPGLRGIGFPAAADFGRALIPAAGGGIEGTGTMRPAPLAGGGFPGPFDGGGIGGGMATCFEAAVATGDGGAPGPIGFSLNLAPGLAFSSVARPITGGGKSTAAGFSDSGGLAGRPGAGFASPTTVTAAPPGREPADETIAGLA